MRAVSKKKITKKQFGFKELVSIYINPSKNALVFFQGYSYTQIIIFLLEELHNKGIRTTIIVSNDELYHFCTDYLSKYYSSLINISIPKYNSRLGNYLGLILDFFRLQKHKNMIRDTENTNILFFSRDYALQEYYFIKKFKKQKTNQIFYLQLGDIGFTTDSTSLKSQLLLSYYTLVYGKDISIVNRGNDRSTRINLEFFSDIKTYTYIKKDVHGIYGKSHCLIKLKDNVKVVFFDEPLDSSIESTNQVRHVVLDTIKSKLKAGENMAIKLHPYQETDYDISKYGEEIPKNIPGELLSIKYCKAVVSFETQLFDESYLKGIPGISLLYLLNIKDKEFEGHYRQRLLKRNSNLYFPKTLDEFTSLLTGFLIN